MAGIWPGSTQCGVLISFDVDGVSALIRRNPDFARYPSMMSMAEYGPSVATPRILDLLDSHDIKGSFYVPGYVAETHPDLVREIVRRGHEVSHHGYMHEPPVSMDAAEEEQVLVRGIEILEGLAGYKPPGYRSPSWELSEVSLELLTSYGFSYDSSMMGDDAPYVLETSKGKIVEIPVHWLLDDAPHFAYAPGAGRLGPMKNPDEVYASWAAEFEGLYHYGRAFILTMHPQYIGRPGRLMMLNRLLHHIKSFPNVTFMTGEEMAGLWSGR